jgi:hypothetical protein
VATVKQRGAALRVPDEAVELFRWAMSIKESPAYDAWEEDGGRHREFLNVSGALDRLLGLELWDLPVTSDSVERDPVSWPLRQALDQAAESQEREGRPLIRLIENGLLESEEIRKSASESLTRSRPG